MRRETDASEPIGKKVQECVTSAAGVSLRGVQGISTKMQAKICFIFHTEQEEEKNHNGNQFGVS